MRDDGPGRLSRAFRGGPLTPLVAGLSFVPPSAFPGPRGAAAAGPAAALGRTCEEAHLDFAFVASWEPWADAAVIELHARGVSALWVVRGVLWPALEAVGVDAGLRATDADPGSLAAPLDAALESARVELARGLGLRAHGVVVAEDLAGSGGPLASPDFVADEVLPRLAALVSLPRRSGLPVVLHSDGDMRLFVPDLRRRGFTGLHGDCGGAAGIDRTLAVARSAGVIVVGGLPTAALAGPESALLAGVEASVRAAAGGLVLADDGGITTGVEFAGLLAAIAAARG